MEDLILTGGTVVTMDGAHRVIPGGAVAVKDGRITACLLYTSPSPRDRG